MNKTKKFKSIFFMLTLLFTVSFSSCIESQKRVSNDEGIILESNQETIPEINVVDKPLPWSENREQLIREYAQLHYGKSETTIVPQAVVIHWTCSDTWQSPYYWFYNETRDDGTLNVASHFIVDRDGTIYKLTEETALNRHIIGYNWCAIGIENVGGIDDREDLTEEQLIANVELIKYLHAKYPTIKYIFGHYQQVAARDSGLYIENVKGYYSIKADPGPTFMRGLREALSGDGLIFFDE